MSMRFWLSALLWLPAGMVAITLARLGLGNGFAIPPAELPMMAASLVMVSPCGLPLALGCRWLWRLGRRRSTRVSGAVLGLFTVYTTIIAGLLGPVAIVVCAVCLSLPVWAMAWFLSRRG